MKTADRRRVGWSFVVIAICLGVIAQLKILELPRKVNPCTANKGNCYSIQGEGSQPGCPGQHTTTVEIDEHIFFLECY